MERCAKISASAIGFAPKHVACAYSLPTANFAGHQTCVLALEPGLSRPSAPALLHRNLVAPHACHIGQRATRLIVSSPQRAT